MYQRIRVARGFIEVLGYVNESIVLSWFPVKRKRVNYDIANSNNNAGHKITNSLIP